jgi:Tol biopolymer transport system component
MNTELNLRYFGSFGLALLVAMPFVTALANNPPTAQMANGGGHPSPSPTPTPTTYSGRIVYTASGTLHIFNLATGSDTSLGVTGTSPKFSLDGSKIVYQNRGVWIINSAAPYSPQQLSATGGVPSFDPTGNQIVYTDSGVWRMNADGSNKIRLTSTGQQSSYSRDGSQIAYNDAVGSSQQLFVMNSDGTAARQVLTSGAVIDTVWSPGPKVVMGVLSSRRNYQLSTFDPNAPGSLTTLLTSSDTNYEPSWSPDGSRISWTASRGIWIMNANGSNQQLVISGGRQGSWGP